MVHVLMEVPVTTTFACATWDTRVKTVVIACHTGIALTKEKMLVNFPMNVVAPPGSLNLIPMTYAITQHSSRLKTSFLKSKGLYI